MPDTPAPPSLDNLHKLQLFRTTLVSFLDWRNFSEVVTGCYVRVLLEMRSDDPRRENSDHYYIACVKGASKGPTYSGFSADGATTEWHIVIELPPCFRSTQNGNVVQLNSISNSPFRPAEYQQWVEMSTDAKIPFLSLPQLQFRVGMLNEQKQQALEPTPRRRRNGEDPQQVAMQERRTAERRSAVERDIEATYMKLPPLEQLKGNSVDSLQEIERVILDLITNVRVAINERSKCMVCRNRACTEICYPCKHQVLCKDCASSINGRCPVPGCTIAVQTTFEAYTS